MTTHETIIITALTTALILVFVMAEIRVARYRKIARLSKMRGHDPDDMRKRVHERLRPGVWSEVWTEERRPTKQAKKEKKSC